jgi:PEGA domain
MAMLPRAVRLLALAGCAHVPAPRVPITVVVRGDATEVASATASLSRDLPELEVRTGTFAVPLEPATGPDADGALNETRAAYDLPNWQKCIAPLADPALVSKLLSVGKREAVSRVLFWRAACLLLKGDEAGARDEGRELAALDLPIPSEKSDPLVPRLLAEAGLEVSRTPPTTLRITSVGPELTVSIDGRASLCVTPCPITARRGKHTVHVEADGRMPEDREVFVEATPAEERFDPPASSPELSARQWVSHWASSPSIDTQPSLHLLADATRARNVALLVAHGGKHESIRGALTVDGAVRARTEKEGVGGAAAPDILRELLVSARIIDRSSVVSKPLFWIGIVVAAGAAAALTYYLATLPHTVTVRP